jgi:hypothetical protein
VRLTAVAVLVVLARALRGLKQLWRKLAPGTLWIRAVPLVRLLPLEPYMPASDAAYWFAALRSAGLFPNQRCYFVR